MAKPAALTVRLKPFKSKVLRSFSSQTAEHHFCPFNSNSDWSHQFIHCGPGSVKTQYKIHKHTHTGAEKLRLQTNECGEQAVHSQCGVFIMSEQLTQQTEVEQQ